jgi:hypothetical protein
MGMLLSAVAATASVVGQPPFTMRRMEGVAVASDRRR